MNVIHCLKCSRLINADLPHCEWCGQPTTPMDKSTDSFKVNCTHCFDNYGKCAWCGTGAKQCEPEPTQPTLPDLIAKEIELRAQIDKAEQELTDLRKLHTAVFYETKKMIKQAYQLQDMTDDAEPSPKAKGPYKPVTEWRL